MEQYLMQMDRSQIWGVNIYRDFTGGENRRIFPELIAPNQVVLARNCIITPEGALESRKGKTLRTAAALPSAIRAAWRWSTANGTQYITAVAANKVYHAEWDGVAAITFGTAVKTLTSSTNKIRGKVWKDVLILSDGVNNPFKVASTGTCTDLSGSPPKFNIFTIHAGKIAAIDYANPSQLRFSGLEDYDTWNALDVYNILNNDGTVCTGLESQPSGLAIHKETSTWTLTGFDRFDFALSTGPIAPVGAVNQDAILPGIFLGSDNFYTCSLPTVAPMKDTHGLSISNYSASARTAAIGCFSTDSRIGIIAVGTDVYCLNGNFQGAVTTWDNLDVTALDYAPDLGVIVMGCSDGNIYTLDNDTDDNGTAFYTDIRTAYLDIGSVRQKVFRNVHHRFDVLAGGYDLYVNAVTDFGASTTLNMTTFPNLNPLEWDVEDWDLADWGDATTGRSDFIHWLHSVRGNYFSVGFKTGSRVKFLGYTVKTREAGALT
jgi:hypothetical protein